MFNKPWCLLRWRIFGCELYIGRDDPSNTGFAISFMQRQYDTSGDYCTEARIQFLVLVVVACRCVG